MARYGLIDDGSGGWTWIDRAAAILLVVPFYGLKDADAGGWEWSTQYSYLLDDVPDDDWEWVAAELAFFPYRYGAGLNAQQGAGASINARTGPRVTIGTRT